jgi:hypothetical protein
LIGTSSGSELHFTNPVAYAGVIKIGPVLSHRFEFANDGPDTIEITDVQASCGCLKPQLSRRILSPAARGELIFQVNTLSQAAGPHTWTACVHYQAHDARYETALQLSARLVSEITVEPAAMVIFADAPLRHQIAVTDLRSRPLRVTAARMNSGDMTTSISEPARDKQGHWRQTIEIQLRADVREGRKDEILEIYSDDPNYSCLEVPITIVKRSQGVTATPGEVSLTAPLNQSFPSRIVLLRDSKDRQVVVDRVTADDPAIVCRWAPGPNSMSTLRISVDRALLHSPSLHSTVTVQLKEPDRTSVTIPVRADTSSR